jgi:hypothetical protein
MLMQILYILIVAIAGQFAWPLFNAVFNRLLDWFTSDIQRIY